MSRKGCPNKKGSITYPRKCEHCDHMSNNASAYYYHKRIHEPIPEGQLCSHGCGNEAKFKNTSGMYTCQESFADCPEWRRKISEKVTKDWQTPGSDERRQNAKITFEKVCVFNEVTKEKNRESQRKRRIIKAEDAKDYRAYARKCRGLAQQWAKDNGHVIGRQTYHVDHRLSIADAYNAKLDTTVTSHPANLQILSAKENSRKFCHSEMTVEELLEAIEKYDAEKNSPT